MARKAVLEGGKRDEIIKAAMQLFFENGYEATSVRMILDQVDGEVGMFYHYFKSKEELFQTVVERFFLDYGQNFAARTANCDSLDTFVDCLLELLEKGMENFHRISDSLHWTIQYSFAARTIKELEPVILTLIERLGYDHREPADIVASQVLYGISGTIHSKSFQTLAIAEKKKVLIEFMVSMGIING